MIIRQGCTVKLTFNGSGIKIRKLSAKDAETAGGVKTIHPQSPVGQVLLGRRAGDRVTVQTPGGSAAIRVLGVSR